LSRCGVASERDDVELRDAARIPGDHGVVARRGQIEALYTGDAYQIFERERRNDAGFLGHKSLLLLSDRRREGTYACQDRHARSLAQGWLALDARP